MDTAGHFEDYDYYFAPDERRIISGNKGYTKRQRLFTHPYEPYEFRRLFNQFLFTHFCCQNNIFSDKVGFVGNLYHDLTDSNIPLIPGCELQIDIELNTNNPEFLVLAKHPKK